MIARKGVNIPVVIMSLLLIFGCGRPEPKDNFELGEEHFYASNYIKAMMKLETWLREDPDDAQGHNTKAHAMLVVMYHDDETRQELFKAKFKTLQDMGEPGMAAVLRLVEHPTIATRLGNTIGDILASGGRLSVPPLMKYMKGVNPRLRVYAREVLVKIGKPAVDTLVQVLDDPDPYNRSRAVEALREIGDESAIKPLEAKLNDPNKLVQVQVAAALHTMGQTNPARKIILDALSDENVQTRRVAARALAEIVDNPPLKSVLEALKDTDADVRNHAALAVGKLGSPEAVQPLVKMLLEDESDQVKASAADSLGKIGKPAVEPLIKLLGGVNDMELTIWIVQTLGTIGDKRAIKPMEKLYRETSNVVLKDQTARALNKID